MRWILIVSAFAALLAPPPAFARQEQQSRAPTTAPALRLPCQFTDDRHLWIDLLPRIDGGPGAFRGFISVGASGAARRFSIQGRFEGRIATAEFTDDEGSSFPCTLILEGLRMNFKTGRTIYELQKCNGGIGINLESDGVRIAQVQKDWPASRAGLRAGDVITAVDGKPIREGRDSGILGDIGTTLQLTVRRADGKTEEFTLTRMSIGLPRDGGLTRLPPPSGRDEAADRDEEPKDSKAPTDPKDR